MVIITGFACLGANLYYLPIAKLGVSILLGVIDAASGAGAEVVFSDVNEDTIQLFEMLGLTNHVTVN